METSGNCHGVFLVFSAVVKHKSKFHSLLFELSTTTFFASPLYFSTCLDAKKGKTKQKPNKPSPPQPRKQTQEVFTEKQGFLKASAGFFVTFTCPQIYTKLWV